MFPKYFENISVLISSRRFEEVDNFEALHVFQSNFIFTFEKTLGCLSAGVWHGSGRATLKIGRFRTSHKIKSDFRWDNDFFFSNIKRTCIDPLKRLLNLKKLDLIGQKPIVDLGSGRVTKKVTHVRHCCLLYRKK